MNKFIAIMLVSAFAGMVMFAGCEKKKSAADAKPAVEHGENDGHDHGAHSKDDGHGH